MLHEDDGNEVMVMPREVKTDQDGREAGSF
jgi:hypothetical protein